MDIRQTTTTDWQIAVTDFGDIAQGADDINQCLNIIFNTQKGSDPLRPDFGVDILAYLDRPAVLMAPDLAVEIIDQVATYETRIDLIGVDYKAVSEKVYFSLTWAYKDDSLKRGINRVKGNTNKTYFLLADQDGFILLNDFDVALIVN